MVIINLIIYNFQNSPIARRVHVRGVVSQHNTNTLNQLNPSLFIYTSTCKCTRRIFSVKILGVPQQHLTNTLHAYSSTYCWYGIRICNQSSSRIGSFLFPTSTGFFSSSPSSFPQSAAKSETILCQTMSPALARALRYCTGLLYIRIFTQVHTLAFSISRLPNLSLIS